MYCTCLVRTLHAESGCWVRCTASWTPSPPVSQSQPTCSPCSPSASTGPTKISKLIWSFSNYGGLHLDKEKELYSVTASFYLVWKPSAFPPLRPTNLCVCFLKADLSFLPKITLFRPNTIVVGFRGRILERNWDKSLKSFLLAIHSHLY